MSPKEFQTSTMLEGRRCLLRAAGAVMVLAVTACGPSDDAAPTGAVGQKTIYGPKSVLFPPPLDSVSDDTVLKILFDDRRDLFDEERPPPGKPPTRGYSWLRSYAEQAGVVIFHKSAFVKDPILMSPNDEVQFQGTSTDGGRSVLGDLPQSCAGGERWCPCDDPSKHNCPEKGGQGPLCPGQGFFFDPRPMSPTVGRYAVLCSGTLIDDDLIATAGHCVEADRVPPRTCVTDVDCDKVVPPLNPNDPECYGGTCPDGVYSTLKRTDGDHPCDTDSGTCMACNDSTDCDGPRDCIDGRCVLQPVRAALQLSDLRIVFNYYKVWTNTLHSIKARDVFKATDIVARSALSQPRDPSLQMPNLINNDDFAILRISRAPGASDGFMPVPVRQDRTSAKPVGVRLPLNTPVGVFGAPQGIPMKLATDRVTVNPDPATPGDHGLRLFGASLDTAGGNSGSGVFDMDKMTLAGILVEGTADYQPRTIGEPNGCWVETYCSDTGFQSTCAPDPNGGPVQAYQTPISIALHALCFDAAGNPTPQNSTRLCAPQDDTANANCLAPEIIPVEFGREITVSGDTTNFSDATYQPSCDTGASGPRPNAFYQFTLTSPSIVYADTFQSEFDTVLALTTPCGGTTGEIQCNDDNSAFHNGASDPCLGAVLQDTNKSRVQWRLGPGTYQLVVSGFNGARGRFHLHFQVLPDSKLAVEDIQRGHHFLAASNDGSSDQVQPFCSAPGGRDIANYFTTCPDYGGGLITANTCNPTTNWDTVLSLNQGNRTLGACSDDILVDPCVRKTDLSPVDNLDVQKFITAGSGLHGLYIDGWGPNDHGFYQLEYTVP